MATTTKFFAALCAVVNDPVTSSDAAIARLISKNDEANPYLDADDDVSNADQDFSDDDEDKPKRKKRSAPRPTKTKEKTGHSSAEASDHGGAGRTKKTVASWSSSEENVFQQQMFIHGRAWRDYSISGRSYEAVRSHAQTYFLLMYRDGQPLPLKVREGGRGYTLSGRALDPAGASAARYIHHDEKTHKKVRIAMRMEAGCECAQESCVCDPAVFGPSHCLCTCHTTINVPLPCTRCTHTSGVCAVDTSKIIGANTTGPVSHSVIFGTRAPAGSRSSSTKPTTVNQRTAARLTASVEPVPDKSQTPPAPVSKAVRGNFIHVEEMLNSDLTPTRVSARARRDMFKSEGDDFNLVKCLQYNKSRPPPFTVFVSRSSLLIMDVHAHMAKTEVIGLLAGVWDPKVKCLAVLTVHPIRSICSKAESKQNAEMDPVQVAMVCEHIKDLGLSVLGWYHSHPTFVPDPSVVDLKNQQQYQALFNGESKPFLGVIVAPYDTRLPTRQSSMKWFHLVSGNAMSLVPFVIPMVSTLSISKSPEPQSGSGTDLLTMDVENNAPSISNSVINCGGTNELLTDKTPDQEALIGGFISTLKSSFINLLSMSYVMHNIRVVVKRYLSLSNSDDGDDKGHHFIDAAQTTQFEAVWRSEAPAPVSTEIKTDDNSIICTHLDKMLGSVRAWCNDHNNDELSEAGDWTNNVENLVSYIETTIKENR